MFVCENCGETFDQPDQQSERERFDRLDGKPSRIVYRDICPFCGSENIDEC